MKKFKMYLGMLFVAALTITSCQTDSVSETSEEQASFETTKRTALENVAIQENVTTVTHNYSYYGERFSVSYTLNNESGEVLGTQGDTERASNVFRSSDEGPQAILFSNLADRGDNVVGPNAISAEYVEIDVQLFNTVEEMEAQVERTSEGVPQEGTELVSGAEGPCSSLDYSGSGRWYFYKHAYYNSEMTPLRRYNRRYFQNHWVGSSYNDQLSSLIVTKPYYSRSLTYLYQHSCFNGRTLGFYQGPGSYGFGIANLKWYTLSGWWWWRTSWNDQVSSTLGQNW